MDLTNHIVLEKDSLQGDEEQKKESTGQCYI